MPFEFEKLGIEGLVLIKPKIIGDKRGYFLESYKKSEFAKNGINIAISQENYSMSHFQVLRGLHYQKAPYAQAKLVQCTKGRIFDVAVDIRPKSKSFGKYEKIELSDKNKFMLYIPKGFAHGFVVLSAEAEIQYNTDGEYAPEAEDGIAWNDKILNIDWGINFEPIISEKDQNLPGFEKIKREELI